MEDKFRIDSQKLVFHPRRVADWVEHKDNWETAKSLYPIYIEIAPIGACNHRCLSGNTPVNTLYGPIPIKHLVGRSVPILTAAGTEVFFSNPINIRKYGENEQVVRVQFTDGTYIDCTPDHNFMRIVTNGHGITRADCLRPNNRVKAIRQTPNDVGYVTVHFGRNFRRMRSRLIMDYAMGRKLKRVEYVHHKDHNIQNDHPVNLEYCESAKAHAMRHPEVAERMRVNNPTLKMTKEWRDNISKSGKGKTRSLEQRMRYRASKLGVKNPNYRGGIGGYRPSRIREVNHVVESVIPLEQREDVYCLEMPVSGWFFANDVLVKNCTFCAVDYIGYKSIQLEASLLIDRIQEMGALGVKSVMLAGEGEPLLHKKINQITEASARALDVAFTTNGVLLNKLEVIDQCEWVKVSVNAGTRETYSKVHRTKPEDFDRVIENLRDAVKRKGKCTLGMQMVLLPENQHEIETLKKIGEDIGVDYVVIKPYSQHKYSETRIYENFTPEIPASAGHLVVRTEALQTKAISYDKCQATPYFWAYVMASGEVYSCSAYLLDERFRLGNIQRSTFRDIWQSDERRRNWEFVRNGLDIHECRLNCRMDKANLYLTDLVKGVPHQAFI